MKSMGRILVDLADTRISAIEADILKHPAVAGVVLFTKNFQNPEQLRELTAQIRAINGNLLITVDHEGGRVWRFKNGFTIMPAMRLIGRLYDHDTEEACTLAYNVGWIVASELLSYGIDLSFTPVLDLDKEVSTIIGDRAFHHNPETVAVLAKALIAGMQAAGMQATGKHFPGHGGCTLDSHLTSVTDDRILATLWAEDMVPFTSCHSHLGAIMSAHVTYPAVDSLPATYSRFWLQNMLREKIGFKGAIVSDCLSMQAAVIVESLPQRMSKAFEAGCDLLILCQQPRDHLLDALNWTEIPAADRETEARIRQLRGNFALKSWEKPKPEIGVLWELSNASSETQ